MSSKILILSALCILCSCWGDKSSTGSAKDIPMEQLDSSAGDLQRDNSQWRQWRPWNIFRWGQRHSMFNSPLTHSSTLLESDNGRHHIHEDRESKAKFKNKIKFILKIQQYSTYLVMHVRRYELSNVFYYSNDKATVYSVNVRVRPLEYIDSQRTLTRRESSVVASRISEGYDTGRTRSTARVQSESATSFLPRPSRPNGTVRKEIITWMFESMLDNIVESWDVIPPPVKPEELSNISEFPKTPSEQTFTSKKSRKGGKDVPPPTGKNSKTKRSRSSKLEYLEQGEPVYQCWWSGSDERAIIRFKNGNLYEGNISMKCMHGEGRFQWADGTVYLGHFNDNSIRGKGIIQWKNDCWYEGDFVGNLRHGQGLYVDSRKRSSYAGGWHCGTKHGQGRIVYASFHDTNTYDGEWEFNVRHGFGSREYTIQSGYMGEWDRYIREGKGLMIWQNSDFYRGGWKNGVMSGYGMYIWKACYNNTMALPSIRAYRGLWLKGERNGYGILNFGLGLGAHYKGEFKDNKKHGPGKLVTNDGMILQNRKMLFNDDVLGPVRDEPPQDTPRPNQHLEPYVFNICDDDVGLDYHIKLAYQNMDREAEIRSNMINNYLEINKEVEPKVSITSKKPDHTKHHKNDTVLLSEEFLKFEESSLRKALRTYETHLKNIYFTYATICNTEEVYLTPIMIRLYLWQFYNDCNVHEKGLNLVEIDTIFHECPDWLSRAPHDPFEKLYFWQFIHSLISVARRLYARRQVPGVRPDTILATAFRTFMDNDALPGCGRRKGLLVNGYGSFVPLLASYKLYKSLGEPHTVRDFLCATRLPTHYGEPQPALVESPEEATPIGRNTYVFGDEMSFVTDEPMIPTSDDDMTPLEDVEMRKILKLSNFGNLTSKSIIKIFSQIFPQLYNGDKIMDLDVEINFYEFFEAFVSCVQKSIHVKEEEMRWKEMLSTSNVAMTPTNPAHTHAHSSAGKSHKNV